MEQISKQEKNFQKAKQIIKKENRNGKKKS